MRAGLMVGAATSRLAGAAAESRDPLAPFRDGRGFHVRIVAAPRAPRTDVAPAHPNDRIHAMLGDACAIVECVGEAIAAGAQVVRGGHDIAEGADGDIWPADLTGRRVLRLSADLAARIRPRRAAASERGLRRAHRGRRAGRAWGGADRPAAEGPWRGGRAAGEQRAKDGPERV
jgi:hypothetical protein